MDGTTSFFYPLCIFEANLFLYRVSAAIEHIPAKERTRKRKSWEAEEVGKMRKVVQEAAKARNTNPNAENTAKFKAAQAQLTETYEREQTEYLQSKIDEIEKASSNKKSAVAWKTVNEISGRRSANTAKLKATSEEERLKLWKKHFEDLLGSAKGERINNNTSGSYCAEHQDRTI